MATYYVRPDGNNANAGTGPLANQAWSTVAYAFANMALPDAVNTLYIAPGTYRESPTLSITPSVSNTLVVSGDPTAAQFSGVAAGRVRITAFTSDNTGFYASTAPTLVFDNKTYFTLQNLHVEGYQQTSGSAVSHFINSKNYTVQNCLFSLYRRGANSNCVLVTTTTNAAINATFDKCIVFGGYACINVQGPTTSTAFNFNVLIKDCYLINGNYSSLITGPSEATSVGNGVSFYNNILEGYSGSIYLRSSNTTNKTLFYNNAFASFVGTGINSSANTVTEDYNRFSCTVDRNGPASGANSQQGVFGYDLDYSRLVNLYTLDYFGAYSGSIVQSTGTPTNAPTVDIFGQTWIGANPDVGAATFKITSGVGAYIPTERNASTITIAPASTSQSIELYLGSTGLTFATSGLAAYYVRNQSAPVAITLVTQTPTGAWTSGGFAEISSSLVPGVYRLDVPNAAFAAGASDVTIVVRGASGTNGAVLTVTLSSGGLTSAQTAAAVWDASRSAYVTAGTFGEYVNTNVNSGAIADAVWDEARSGHTTVGTFGQYVNAELVTPVTSAALVRMGPFEVRADGLGASDPLDLQTGAQHGIDIQCVDNNGAGIDITSATVTAKVYNSGATLVDTYSCTATYAADGRATFTIDTTVTNTPGTYTVTITRSTSANDTQIFGPLRIYVRDI